MTTTTDLSEARRLRDSARGIVRTDLATLRMELAERSIPMRVRDEIIAKATGVAEEGVALADENRVIVGATVAALFGWLFRNPIGTLSRRAYFKARRAFKRWRA